jgi:O-methyltransferase/aklanonic acid methyltransferase
MSIDRIWSRLVGETDLSGLDYWEYFGMKLVERAKVYPGARLLDVGCGTGSSLFPAATRIGSQGYAVGIDLCPN